MIKLEGEETHPTSFCQNEDFFWGQCQNEDFFLNFAKKRIFCVFCAKKRISQWILFFSCDIARKLFNIWCFIALCHCLLLYSKFWGASSLFSFYYFYLFILTYIYVFSVKFLLNIIYLKKLNIIYLKIILYFDSLIRYL